MIIKLADNYGFCFGVKRAIKIAEENRNSQTYGPLIHNSKEIERLKKNFNVGLSEDLSMFKKSDKVVIRTHGIPKNELDVLEKKEANVIDATCPYVTKPQQICEKMSDEGYDIVIFGDENHPEIKGVKSYAKNGAYVVLSAEDLQDHFLRDKIALVAQTTRKIEDFMQIANYLIENYKEVRVFNTICNATFENQAATRKLSKEADIMIVIGGKNSSNTKQLYYIASQSCLNSYHIEGADDLKAEWFGKKEVCGISAGASTPDWIVSEVVEAIDKIVNKAEAS